MERPRGAPPNTTSPGGTLQQQQQSSDAFSQQAGLDPPQSTTNSGQRVEQQQQQQQQQAQPPTLAPTAAAAAATGTPTFQLYRDEPYTTPDLVCTGDQLLKEYLHPQMNFLGAIRAGSYKRHQHLLNSIWSYIQSVPLSDTDTVAASSSNVDKRLFVREVPSSLPAPRSAAAAAGSSHGGLVPHHFLLQPPGSSERSSTVLHKPASVDQRGSEAPDPEAAPAAAAEGEGLYGIARDFSSYSSATPIAIGDGRYLINVRQDVSEMYPGWEFRLWVCAVKQQHQQQQQQQQQELGKEKAELLHDFEPPDIDDPRYMLQGALLEGDLPTPGAVWQYNSSHYSIAGLHYKPGRRKSRSAAETAATAANNSASATESLLLDVSVGWCVFQYMPRQQQQRKVKVGSSASGAADVSMKRSRSLPQDALQGSAATAAIAQLTERLRQLEIQANPSTPQTPQQLLAFFWPASNVAAAAAARLAANPPVAAAAKHDIQQRLLQHDVRDKFGRNVLHLVASCKPEDMDPSSLKTSMYQLDILLDNPELLDKLQHQINNNRSTPLLVAATHGVPEVYTRLLAAADLNVMQQLTESGFRVLHRLAHSAAVAADQGTSQIFENLIVLTMHRIKDLAYGGGPVAAVADPQQQQILLQGINELITRLVNVPQPSGKYYKGREVLERVVNSVLPALLLGTQA